MDDDHETRLVTEPPAPQPGDVVHYRDFLEILIETLEDRFLIGDPPDVSDAANAESLQYRLNQAVVKLAHRAHEVGQNLDTADVKQGDIEDLRDAVSAIETAIDEIEAEHSER